MAQSTPAIAERLRGEGVRVVRIEGAVGGERDLEQTIALARSEVPSWVVTDGYQFGSHYPRTLKDAGFRVMSVDDNGRCGTYAADFVLNQNIHACEDLYQDRAPHTRLLLGPEYALLRREFTCLGGYQRKIRSVARNLLVAMGGSDPGNVTLRVLEAINQVDVPALRVAVVAGGDNPHTASIRQRITSFRHDCRLLENVTNMPELITWADLAVSAAGSICWEYCLLGLPAILLAIAENQIPATRSLHAVGAAIVAGGGPEFATKEMADMVTRLVNSPMERERLSRRAQTIVDGRGVHRTLSSLECAKIS